MTEVEVVGLVVASREEEEVEATVAEVEAMGAEAEEVLPAPHVSIGHSMCTQCSSRLAKSSVLFLNCLSFMICYMTTCSEITWKGTTAFCVTDDYGGGGRGGGFGGGGGRGDFGGGRGGGRGGGGPPGRPGDWACPSCSNNCFASKYAVTPMLQDPYIATQTLS